MTAITPNPRFRFVLTLAARDARHLEIACSVLRCHPGTIGVEKLSSATCNWLLEAEGASRGLAPQMDAAAWHVTPVVAGLAAAQVLEAVNWQSCRQIGPRGGLGEELPVL
jgi:hypothetical protein